VLDLDRAMLDLQAVVEEHGAHGIPRLVAANPDNDEALRAVAYISMTSAVPRLEHDLTDDEKDDLVTAAMSFGFVTAHLGFLLGRPSKEDDHG
jgi:hypothetical protein